MLHAEDEAEADQGHGAERVLSKQPIVVFVKFNDAEWKLPGVDEVGVYPVRSVVRDWYLDRNRKYPKLKVKRHQLPLAPGFAMTAHASQGATLQNTIVDLQIPETASWITIYVALSRVRRADDVLIFRKFDIEPLQRGDCNIVEEFARRYDRLGSHWQYPHPAEEVLGMLATPQQDRF